MGLGLLGLILSLYPFLSLQFEAKQYRNQVKVAESHFATFGIDMLNIVFKAMLGSSSTPLLNA